MDGTVSKRSPRINYDEDSDYEEEEGIMNLINEDEQEREVELQEGSFGELNLKKQYRRAFIAAQNRIDWKILEEKTTPKNVALKESVYFYLEFHPGVFKLVVDEV